MAEKSTIRPRHLGRGLESLLGPVSRPDLDEEAERQGSPPGDDGTEPSVRELPVEAISPNPHQARVHWDEEKLKELAMSIEANGIVQPIVVRKTALGYQLIAGERRFRASQMIGRKTIPAFVREASEEQMLELALVENIHRADLNPVERAKAYQSYIKRFGLTHAEAAGRLGEERSVVSNHLRILELPADLCRMLTDGELSMGHAKAILSLPDDETRRRLANRALAGRLSVRELERLVGEVTNGAPGRTKRAERSPHLVDLEGRLTNQLGSRVRIETRKKGDKGRLIIEFNTLNEFDSVLEKLGVQCADEL